jgi:hypothetical protein
VSPPTTKAAADEPAALKTAVEPKPALPRRYDDPPTAVFTIAVVSSLDMIQQDDCRDIVIYYIIQRRQVNQTI